MINVNNCRKTFTLHLQGGAQLPVLEHASFSIMPGECVALTGHSGAGKSTLMRMIYGNYLADGGSIQVDGTEIVGASPRTILALRRSTLGYVSQFLRVVPRVPTLDVVAEPLVTLGVAVEDARARAGDLLTRLSLPHALWSLPPATFSGGEQQRINIARGLIHRYPALLVDEPTASLDRANRQVVLDLIGEAKAEGAAILGIFHDLEARAAVCDREVDVSAFLPGRSPSAHTEPASA
ncbi:MAG: phosphonate C-P lyase system protein PhnL [Pseudomonadota bacterium]